MNENIEDFSNENYMVKLEKGNGLDGDNDIKNTLSSHLGAFFSDSKRILNTSIREVNGFYNKNVNYTVTDSLYIEKILACDR